MEAVQTTVLAALVEVTADPSAGARLAASWVMASGLIAAMLIVAVGAIRTRLALGRGDERYSVWMRFVWFCLAAVGAVLLSVLVAAIVRS